MGIICKILSLFFLIIFSIVILGCVNIYSTPTGLLVQEQNQDANKTSITKAEQSLLNQSQVNESASQVNVSQLLKKHIGKVNSMTYKYQDPVNYPSSWKVFVKDNIVRIVFTGLQYERAELYFDALYLDLKNKNANAFCERDDYRCQKSNKPITVNFEKYARKTPVDWIKEVKHATEVGRESKNDRRVVIIESIKDNSKIKLWVDEYSGLPVKVEAIKGFDVDTYLFEDLVINSVSDSDLLHTLTSEKYR